MTTDAAIDSIDFSEVPTVKIGVLIVTETHRQNSDASGYTVVPDFWDNEPTVRIQLCPHCVRLLNRCRCGATR